MKINREIEKIMVFIRHPLLQTTALLCLQYGLDRCPAGKCTLKGL
ncbi:hypothetical protein AAJ76_1510002467 [Vairimorpha ceranae]|uniref:Uncharacterized protein n=1 Tax=Vairimorpha ceranae TaxID=40302 RepID=A0A0F9WAM9_9MICR|nr:hypothetical protein AAJ76_1510002467 [Vairimorpha ceranae]KKO73985.1 hypothetical protein AAJ76_1510002467 [Vairimorpha ceranae]